MKNIKHIVVKSLLVLITPVVTILLTTGYAAAQKKDQYIRLAKINVDSSQLENYKHALEEGIKTAVKVEPGVITLYAMYDKNDPTSITVFEVYASVDAYKAHIETPHFKKYKNTTAKMVTSLELTDVVPIAFESKPIK